jgi:hypothetical protein
MPFGRSAFARHLRLVGQLVDEPRDMTNVLLSGLLRPVRRDIHWDAQRREAHFQALGSVLDLEDGEQLGYVGRPSQRRHLHAVCDAPRSRPGASTGSL